MAKFKTLNADTGGYNKLAATQYLWICVLSRAVHDALFVNDYVETRKAMAWFEAADSDFKLVCDYAGRNPAYVHARIIPKINERRQSMTETKEKYGTRFTKIVCKFEKGEWINEHQPQSNM